MRGNMKENLKSALLISDSHLWGLWSYQALEKINLDFEPLLAEEIDETFSNKYKALFVPGGWSKNKLEALSKKQREILRNFVAEGGIYIGICGGASLAGEEGLGLLSVRRKKERVPSFSGPCWVDFDKRHPLFKKIKDVFYLWFPPELEILNPKIQILAYFRGPQEGAYVSDLFLEDHKEHLDFLENLYNIPLNPNKMQGKPLILEGTFEKGRILLSLIHFDTPKCENGLKFLKNLTNYYQLPLNLNPLKIKTRKTLSQVNYRRKLAKCIKEVKGLIDLGIRNFLLHKRTSYFYQWKRGIKGLEILNLFYLFEEIERLLYKLELKKENLNSLEKLCEEIEPLIKKVVLALRYDLLSNRGIKIKEASILFEKVFGKNKKSYGGEYKRLINLLEKVLVKLWREERK